MSVRAIKRALVTVCLPVAITLVTAGPAPASSARLPTGAANGFPFGYVRADGVKVSLLPPNDADVNQARASSAPKVGPFRISTKKGLADWPSACALTDLAQLKALLPSVRGLRGRPVGSKGQELGTGRSTPHDTQCRFNLVTSFAPKGYKRYSNVQVQLSQIGPGTAVQWAKARAEQAAQSKKYPAQYAFYPHLNNRVECFDDGTELQCLKGEVDYWVMGQKITGGSFPSSDQAVWVEQLELPLAEVLGAEISTTP